MLVNPRTCLLFISNSDNLSKQHIHKNKSIFFLNIVHDNNIFGICRMSGSVIFVVLNQEEDLVSFQSQQPTLFIKHLLLLINFFFLVESAEATFDVLPRLNEIKFASGVIDELLYLSVPSERRFPSGIMVLEYAKAVQESVFEHIRVIREGHLRIIFSQELKILSWEFCTRRHEELLPRRLVAPQVNI